MINLALYGILFKRMGMGYSLISFLPLGGGRLIFLIHNRTKTKETAPMQQVQILL